MNARLWFFLLYFGALFATHADEVAVGKVGFAKGSNAAQQPNAPPRVLGKDAPIYQGDIIQTCESSFVVVEFNDGSKVTVRPNSNFKIEQFDSVSKSAKLTVYEGGVKASTGEIAKAGGDAFQIKTPTATLKGQKDSEYAVRVCKGDCDDKKEAAKDASVAKVVDVKGDVLARSRHDKNADERRLSIGSGINAEDYLTSMANSHLVMVFRDGEKVTLLANSEFDIVKYDYQQAGKKDQVLFKLAAGGMRALTGSIGKKDHAAYALDTPVATIGIRGTQYDTINMGGEGTDDSGNFTSVSEGSVALANGGGETVVNQGQVAQVSTPDAPAVIVPAMPAAATSQINATPNPKNAPDPGQVYSSGSTKSGSYVSVSKGSGKLESNAPSDEKSEKSEKTDKGDSKGGDKASSDKNDNKSSSAVAASSDEGGSGGGGDKPAGTSSSVTLSEGESSFAGEGGSAEKLAEPPAVLAKDDTPAPSAFDSNAAGAAQFSPISDTTGGAKGGGCVVE